VEKRKFTGSSLEEALKDGSLEKAALELIGMVKSSEREDHINFARGDCETWIELPTNLIEQAEELGRRPCKDHVHPVFKLTLKEPTGPVARIFASLLATQPSTSSQPGGRRPPEWAGSVEQGLPEIRRGMRGASVGHNPAVRRSYGSRSPSPPRTITRSGDFSDNFPLPWDNSPWGWEYCWNTCCGDWICMAGHYEAGPTGWQWVCDWSECSEPCQRCIGW